MLVLCKQAHIPQQFYEYSMQVHTHSRPFWPTVVMFVVYWEYDVSVCLYVCPHIQASNNLQTTEYKSSFYK